MARLAPIFLAFLINWYGLMLYKMIPPLCICSTLISRRLFTFGTYFILIDTDLYPRKFKSVHWLVRNTIEFLIGLYIMETFLGEFWFPLENAILRLLVVTAKIIRVYSPKSGSIYKVSSNIFDILTNKKTPMLTSIVLSAAFLVVALHGTRTIDFGIIPRCGVPEFLSHVLNKTKKGLRKLKKSFLLKSDKSDICR